jgi:hypothetical protein
MKTKLTVVVDGQGNVVATHAPARKPAAGSIHIESGLGTLPGQTLHEIEFEVPESFQHEQEIVEFHRRIRDHIAKGYK